MRQCANNECHPWPTPPRQLVADRRPRLIRDLLSRGHDVSLQDESVDSTRRADDANDLSDRGGGVFVRRQNLSGMKKWNSTRHNLRAVVFRGEQ